MEFTAEFVEEHKLTPEQVTAISGLASNHIADLKGQWDNKANENAEKIIDGAIASTQKFGGIELQRQEGEKHADYLSRYSQAYLKSSKESLEASKIEYEEKAKGVKGNETLAKEFDELKGKYSTLQQKEADFDTLLSSGIKEKYEALVLENEEFLISSAFNSVKPTRGEDVNEYEFNHKWSQYQKETLKEWTPKRVEDKWVLINKENPHKTIELSEHAGKDTALTELTKGRQQKGINGKPVDKIQVEGVPFNVPETAITDTKERSKIIKDYLTGTKKLNPTDPTWTAEFTKLNNAIRLMQAA